MTTWGKLLKSFVRLALAAPPALLLLPIPVFAQTTTYVNLTDGPLNQTGTSCSNPLVRNFSVGSNFTVSDVDIGVFASHSYRGGLRMTLQSPAGTRVQIVDGNLYSIDGDNFNARLDDDSAQTINTDGNGTSHPTANPPPFSNNFAPNNPLSAFVGQSSSGTWRLEICNQTMQILWFSFGGTGTFHHAELYLSRVPSSYADLSLSKTVSSPNPASGASLNYSLTVRNASASPSSAAGVAVTDLLPPGVSYTGHSGFGTYDPGTGLWTVDTLTPGQSRTLTITATVTASAGATITAGAEVTASAIVDSDSTPANGANDEDDYDEATFTVAGSRVAGTPPTLICPKNMLLFDWDGRTWSPGATSASYAVTGLGTIGFQIANPANWMNNFGGISPIRTNTVTGGFSPAQYSLAQAIDFATDTQVATTTITLPLAVDGLQFRIFDVDYYGGQFADRVRVTGTFNGASVTPVLTNGVANYTIGNQAFGDALSADASSDGTVVVTLQSAVDTVVIEYGNHPLSPANPGGQAITLHDITLCAPHADISITKITSVLNDPVRGATNPVALPGALVSYCILITNAGSAAASAIVASDTLPATMAFVPGSMRSGSACGATTTIEDDNAAGADENDPVGASIAGNQLSVTASSLGSSQSIALSFNTTIN